MTLRHFRLLALLLILLVAELHGAEVATKSGIIKGTITVAGKPTTDVVVSLEGISAETAKAQSSAAKPKKAIMDQREMKFLPRVLPVMVGSTVEFPNHDTAWHNVYSKGGAKILISGFIHREKLEALRLISPEWLESCATPILIWRLLSS